MRFFRAWLKTPCQLLGEAVLVFGWALEASNTVVFIPVSAIDGLLERQLSPVEHLPLKGCSVISAIHSLPVSYLPESKKIFFFYQWSFLNYLGLWTSSIGKKSNSKKYICFKHYWSIYLFMDVWPVLIAYFTSGILSICLQHHRWPCG